MFRHITEEETITIIDKMKNKSSSGYDKPLTLIINQMLDSGIFPSGIKISKILPIFKKGDVHSFNNYRPISMLPAISKIIFIPYDIWFTTMG